MSHLRHIYRSNSCKALAEKVANSDVHKSLDIILHIEEVLKNRDPKTIADIQQAIANNEPFSLFSDKNHYCIIIPCNLVVACYVEQQQITMEVCKDEKQFQNRVKLAFAVYEHFRGVNRIVESGRHGTREISKNGCGEDMSDGTEYHELIER